MKTFQFCLVAVVLLVGAVWGQGADVIPEEKNLRCTNTELSSWGFAYASRVVRREVVRMRVLEKQSDSDCTRGTSFGFDNAEGILWVDKGCRAIFRVCFERRECQPENCVGDSVDSCKGKADGNYLPCGDLCKEGWYISCSNGHRFQMPCALGWYQNAEGRFTAKTVYNPSTDSCEFKSAACPRDLDQHVIE